QGPRAPPGGAGRGQRRPVLEAASPRPRDEPPRDGRGNLGSSGSPGRRRLMARYLVYTSPARGHLYPLVPTLLELRRRGHEVAVRTLASEVELMRDLGFDAEPIDSAIEEAGIEDWRAKTPIGALKASLAGFFDRARHDGPDLRRAVQEKRPDALLVDVNTWGAAAAAS